MWLNSIYLCLSPLSWLSHLQNSKLSTLTAVVPDIPGFRKILPRSDYIIIPKSSLQEDRSCPQLELCVAQNQMSPKGPSLVSNSGLETVPSHTGMAEQCLAVEALAEEVGALAQPGAVQEITTSDILSQDVLLEEASLDVGENHQPYQTSLVIEETLVNGSPDLPTASLAVPQPQVGEGLSVVTVMRVSGFLLMSLTFFRITEKTASGTQCDSGAVVVKRAANVAPLVGRQSSSTFLPLALIQSCSLSQAPSLAPVAQHSWGFLPMR